LNDLKVSEDQFVDICIFAGFEWSSTFPPLTQPIVDVGNGAMVGTFITFTFKGKNNAKEGIDAKSSF
jgi:hypothetical protein